MSRRRKIFTKREYEKLSRSHEGRLHIYKTYLATSLLALIGGIIFAFSCKYMCIEDLAWLGFLFVVGGGISATIFLFMIQSENDTEKERIKINQEQERIFKENELKEKKAKEAQYIEHLDKLQKSNIEQVDLMSGFEFEEFVGSILSNLGYKSCTTKKSGDFGVDIILEKDEKKIIVQTKRYSKKVSVGAIQEISTAQNFYGIYNAWVVTNNYFTESAIKLAESNHIKLVNRDELISLILKSKEASKKVSPAIVDEKCSQTNGNGSNPIKNINEVNDFSEKVLVSQNRVLSFFNNLDCKNIYNEALYVNNFPVYNKQNYISLHFFYIETAKYLHRLSGQVPEADNYALLVCEMDFKILKEISAIMTEPYACPTATIACIILERLKEYQKVIEYCDFFINMHANETSGNSFIFRKNKLQKRLIKNNPNP